MKNNSKKFKSGIYQQGNIASSCTNGFVNIYGDGIVPNGTGYAVHMPKDEATSTSYSKEDLASKITNAVLSWFKSR